MPSQLSFILDVILSSFAVYRVSRMLAQEDGPFEIFKRTRDWSFKKYNNHWVVTGIHCVLCISFWISIIPAICFGYYFYLNVPEIFLLWFGIAGIVVFLFRQEHNP